MIRRFTPAAVLATHLCASLQAQVVTNFGVITVPAGFELNGAGLNVDSLAFWEPPDPTNTLLFVTGKNNDLLEVWAYPFVGNEQAPITFPSNINGVVVDQETDRLYVSDRIVSVFSLPGREPIGEFGQGIIGVGEGNLDILKRSDGQTVIYTSDDHSVHAFDAESTNYLGAIVPPVGSIETVLADDYYQAVLIPDEQGPLGNPGVYAYHPDGSPFERNGTNRFGNGGEFDADAEGILLYSFPPNGSEDDGSGFYVVSDQRFDHTDFEFFDRQTWAHLGTLLIEGVSNTDGIASTQRALPDYPLGLFVAIDDDTTTVGVGWDVILEAMGYTPYQVWTFAHGLDPASNAGTADDPDGDGANNLREFAVHGDPLAATKERNQQVSIQDNNGVHSLLYTFPVRSGALFTPSDTPSASVDGVVYHLQGSANLSTFSAPVTQVLPADITNLPSIPPGWMYHSFQSTTTPAGYILLSISPAPGP